MLDQTYTCQEGKGFNRRTVMRRLFYCSLPKWLALAFLLLVCACSIAPQALRATRATPSPTPTPEAQARDSSDAINRPTSKPYSGELSIFEDPKRDEKLQVNRVMDVLGIKEGTSVADIGAGSGWFTVRAARRVGANATVYAVDINRDYLKHIDDRAAREKLPTIKT